MNWVGLGLLGIGAALCAGSTPLSLPGGSATSREQELLPGKLVSKDLEAGEIHEYRLPLASGEVVDVRIEQDGVDVSLSFLSPDRETLLSVDTPKDIRGAERLFAFAETGGMYRLRVRGAAGKDPGLRGSYVLRRAPQRLAGPGDRVRARAWREYSQGEALRRASPEEAKPHYDTAFRLWQILGDRDQQAIALYRGAGILRDLGHLREAVASYAQALPLTEYLWLRLSILNLLTRLHLDLGNTQQALLAGEQAVALAPRAGDPFLHASALNNLGTIYRRWGETDKALEYFEASLEQWRQVGAHPEMARTLINRAEILLAIGNPKPVLGIVKESLLVLEEVGQPGGDGTQYRLLGVARDQLGSPQTALYYLDLARQKARDTKNPGFEALALNEKGSILLKMGDLEKARRAFDEARRIAGKSGLLDNEAFALAGLGKVLLEQGDAAGAIELFARGERLYGKLGDPNALALVLYGRALAERSQGRIEAARRSIERALDLVEELREGVGQRDLRSHVIGARADFYDLKVDLLLRLHEQRRDLGLDATAFAASEWRRSRSLLEMVEKMGAGLPKDLPTETVRRQVRLRFQLQRLAQEKLKIVSGAKMSGGSRGLPAIEREIQETVAQWEALSEEMRRQSPAYAAVTAPKLVSVREVQELLDAETALVAYTVGEERSILWWIEKDALEVHQDLPRRAELEHLADDAYDLLSRPQSKQRERMQRVLDKLGASLLEPIASRLSGVRRIAVVADETLQILPFAALTVPGSGEPLVESHAVVQLPSASLAAALRARQQGRAVPPEIMAVFGDPVFGSSDERARQGRGLPGRIGDPQLGELPRLPESAREVKAILDLVPAAKSRRLIGFAANRRAAMDPDLEHYRYIHFATHGIVDLANPELSGIQLSRINPQGRPLEGQGILPFYEVYNLHFPADLVTLSACRTAVGQAVRGEGQLGLSRSFLYAGASRVIGTLWDVDDRDAADLMTLFYQALLRDGKSPAMALQEAQKGMRAREKTRAPYHWAGFVLQGDWR